jgi:hypothetical protein
LSDPLTDDPVPASCALPESGFVAFFQPSLAFEFGSNLSIPSEPSGRCRLGPALLPDRPPVLVGEAPRVTIGSSLRHPTPHINAARESGSRSLAAARRIRSSELTAKRFEASTVVKDA